MLYDDALAKLTMRCYDAIAVQPKFIAEQLNRFCRNDNVREGDVLRAV